MLPELLELERRLEALIVRVGQREAAHRQRLQALQSELTHLQQALAQERARREQLQEQLLRTRTQLLELRARLTSEGGDEQ